MNKLYPILLLLISWAVTGCGTLDKSGVYGGDKALYDADLALSASYDTLHQFVLWEYQNRQALAGTPEIKAAADTIRKQAPQWYATAFALRDAYKASPNPGTMEALQRSLNLIHAAVLESVKYLSRPPPVSITNPPLPPVPGSF
jgi:hypothetical protein